MMRLIGEAPSRNTSVDLWYAQIIALTCADIEDCCYVELGVDVEALSMKIVAPYAAQLHGCDRQMDDQGNPKPPCDVPEGSRLWVMTTQEFLRAYDGSAPDVVFIDASHEYTDACADFYGVMERWPRAIVFLHDTWPGGMAAGPPQAWHAFCGDVWRLREDLEASSEYEAFTWRHDPGLTVVQRRWTVPSGGSTG